jgi:HTH-type transcriptional regulator/antitoxin HigA
LERQGFIYSLNGLGVMQNTPNYVKKENNIQRINTKILKKIVDMELLKYKIIKTQEQYNAYCNLLEDLLIQDNPNLLDDIELLTLLIEKWDKENNSFYDLDPVQLIKALMKENGLKAKDLTDILDLSKGTISKILSYHKGLSKETIRKLADYFKVSQEAFNRPYKLVNEINRHFRNASLMNTKKELGNKIAV